MTMRFLLSLLLVALIATSTVQAKQRLRGERSVIDHDPEEVQRVLKQLTVKNRFTTPGAAGTGSALDTVRANLARKGSKGAKGTRTVTTPAATTFPVTPTTTPPVSTPATKGSMGASTGGKGRKGDSDTVAPALPTIAPAPTPQTFAPTKSTKGSSKGSTAPALPTVAPAPTPAATKGSKSAGKNARKGEGTDVDMNEVSFFHLAPNNAIPVSASDTNFEEVGTVFIYGGPLYDVNATIIPNTNFTGVCTKTQKAEVIDENRTLVGGGYCQFTYILDIAADGTPLTTMNAAGEVFDLQGGTMAVTGGTGTLIGAGGQAKVLPLYANESTLFDFFTRAIVYEVNATIAFTMG